MPRRQKIVVPPLHGFKRAFDPARLTKRSRPGDYDLTHGQRNVGRVFKTKEGRKTWTLFLRGENTFTKGFKSRKEALEYYKRK
jgi:hypothetical protein